MDVTKPRKRVAKLCRHCEKNKCNRTRGLCWRCFYTPGVRDLYPSTSKFARISGVGLGQLALAELPEPTSALPGSIEKVAVLAERAARGLALWHPLDIRDARGMPVQANEPDTQADPLADVHVLADLLELRGQKVSRHPWRYKWKQKA